MEPLTGIQSNGWLLLHIKNSLLRHGNDYGRKKFYSFGPKGQCHKTFLLFINVTMKEPHFLSSKLLSLS
jgi:hypothetical protein